MLTGKFFTRSIQLLLICAAWFIQISSVSAAPISVYDARTMAMAGVGIATGTHNAVFTNPALMTTADEIHEWYLLLPAVAQERQDIDDLEDKLTAYQEGSVGINAIDGIYYHASNNSSVMVAIPSRILSGAIYLNSSEQFSAKPSIVTSTLAHRGIRIIENGVSAARVLDSNKGWTSNMAIGFSAKFLLVETYNYETDLSSAEIDVDGSQGSNDSQFGLDIGMIKEIGVWKIAVVGKNLIPGKYSLTGSDDDIKIDPQIRAGFAYQSRRAVLEFNLDVLKNEQVGFESETQIAALGWEYQPGRNFALRAGYKQNMVGTKASYFSSGVGINYAGLHVDVGAYTGDEGQGMAGQVGFQF